ncbi:MAG: hypothetical protein PVI91_12485 [Gammaproteobacteria bacterium]
MTAKQTRRGSRALACLLMLGAGAGLAADPNAAPSAATDTTDFAELKREWADAIRALKSYSAGQRDEAVARAKETLDAMDRRIDQLETRAQQQWANLSESARQKREASLRALRKQRNEVAQWYGGMKHSSAGAWESVKQGFIESYGVLGQSFRQAWDELDSDEEVGP